jgi:hypothetical protein
MIKTIKRNEEGPVKIRANSIPNGQVFLGRPIDAVATEVWLKLYVLPKTQEKLKCTSMQGDLLFVNLQEGGHPHFIQYDSMVHSYKPMDAEITLTEKNMDAY